MVILIEFMLYFKYQYFFYKLSQSRQSLTLTKQNTHGNCIWREYADPYETVRFPLHWDETEMKRTSCMLCQREKGN
jgi:hypothetical protein